MEINLNGIEAELQGAAGSVKVKVKRHNGCRCSIRETDRKLEIRINPKRIRSERQMDEVRQFCFGSLEC